LDDVSALEKDDGQGGIGPLLVIKEILLDSVSTSEDSVEPVCEYGITLVDAATGAVTLGQFADDVLRSRMNTLLTKYRPSEILMQNGSESCSKTLKALIHSMKNTILPSCTIGMVNCIESFPSCMALDADVRAKMQRTSKLKPWDKDETLKELHRRAYFPRSSRKNQADGSSDAGISRWPDVLKVCVEGGADLAISSLGAALFYLQRSLIDEEILSMGIVKAYIPPDPATIPTRSDENIVPHASLTQLASEEQRLEDGIDQVENVAFASQETDDSFESEINHMSLDGTTIANLEILANLHSNTAAGSLWSKVNYTKSPFGSRLLRAWLLRPLFRKTDIERRADAVEELVSGAAAAAMSEARDVLGKCGDMERLLSRVHSMSGSDSGSSHPNERAVLYETATNTKRKVGDFSKLLNGLRAASQIPELFDGIEISSGLLNRIVRTTDNGGLFPSKLSEHLDWFFDNFDCIQAAKGLFEPARGIDEDFDEACDAIDRIKQELEDYRDEMCSGVLRPTHLAKQWKYANTRGMCI
jgi:DNA mismatch repair protein MSH6